MNIKLLCHCGTKFAFEVEPADGQMPFAVTCPNCHLEVTEFANQYIAQMLAPALPETAPAPVTPAVDPTPAQPIGSGVNGPSVSEPAPASAALGSTLPGVEPVSQGGGLKLGLKKKKEAPEPAGVPETAGAAADDAPALGFQAKREERLAELQQKRELDAAMWRKVAWIGWAIGFVVVALIAAYLWYWFSGSRPKDYYEVGVQGYNAQAKLLGPDELLVLDDGGVALHDLKSGNARWNTPVKTPVAPESPGGGRPGRFVFRGGGQEYALHVTEADIWALCGNRVLQLDRATGAQKKEIPLQGTLSTFAPGERAILVVCLLDKGRSQATRIDLASGEATTEVVELTGSERATVASQNSASKLPTQGNLLAEELGFKGSRSLWKYRSAVVAAGENLVRLEVRLLQSKVVSVKAMKDAGPSRLNAKTSSASNPMAIAEEVFNEQRRSEGGAYKEMDESTYEVTLSRVMAGGASPWTGRTVGPTGFYPMKTVDVLAGSKEIYLLDKNNKLLKQDKLTFPVSEEFASGFNPPGTAPCLELGNSLYFFDQGVLTAFDLPSGEVRWRLTSVGISRIQPDDKGHLYVNTTSASPESIQYSEQINLTDRPHAVVLKVDAASGKILWKREDAGHACYLSGKFLYSTRFKGGSPLSPFAPSGDGESLWIYRLNPRNGNLIWEHFCKPAPAQVQFLETRILLQQPNELRVLKFLSL